MSNVIEQIAVASELRHRDGRNVVAERIYEQVVMPMEQKLTESERYGRQADITIENLERKVEQLAAENAALKAAAEFATAPDMWVEQADGMLDYRYVEWYVDVLKAAMETPVTDAILAEVRASGADECVRQLVISDADDFSDAPNVCAMVAHQFRQEAK